jgi:hypothetical protein
MHSKKPSVYLNRLEHRSQLPLPPAKFAGRLARHVGGAVALVSLALAGGMLGYRELEGLSWLDAFLNAAMILGGMGPVNTLQTEAGKLFAGCYALFSGLVFLVVAGLVFAPLVHRMLHLFHFDSKDFDKKRLMIFLKFLRVLCPGFSNVALARLIQQKSK